MFSSGKLLASPSAGDPYFNYTSLLLNENDTNGAQNNTFVDGSTNNFTITRNGNTTQGSFTPFGNLWSNYFNSATSDYLQSPTNTALNFNSVDYTAECWVYLDMSTYSSFDLGGRGIFSDYLTNSSGRWAVIINSSGRLEFAEQNALGASSVSVIDSANFPLRQWVHVAAVKSGTTMYLFKNGVSVGTNTSAVRTTFGGRINVGQFTIDASYRSYFLGFISNVRLIKGTALYTSGFTPSTTPLTAISGTAFLTCQSNRFIDNSTNNFSITTSGSPRIFRSTPFSLGRSYSTSVDGASGYFDGTGDYLAVPMNAAFDFGSGDFTIEAFVYITTTPTSYKSIIGRWGGVGNTASWNMFFFSNTTRPGFELNYTGSPGVVSSPTALGLNTWHHLALVRNGTTVTLYANGTSVATSTGVGTLVTGVGNVSIGTNLDAIASQSFPGYISNARVVKGTAVYTSNFTPPTSPLTPISNTSLLLNFSNAGIYNATRINVLETLGNAQVSTAQAKWGSSSVYFDGTGDYLKAVGDATAFEFRNGDFTIEFFVYLNATQTSVIYDGRSTGVSTTQPTIYVNSNAIRYYTNALDRITGSTISNNTWTHIALTRSGTSTRLFLNGTQTGSTYTDSINYTNTANRPVIGLDGFSENTQFLNGYIQDLRVTKDIARYTANFTPPTAAFPTR